VTEQRNSNIDSRLGVWMSLIRYRVLIGKLVKRQIADRYRGSLFGMLWTLAYPIMLLVVYTFVFGTIFRARWSGGDASQTQVEFAVILFTGLIIHGLFSEILMASPGLIINNPQYVKKVIFPLEILSWVTLFTALFNAGVSLLVLIVFYFLVHGSLYPSLLWLPVIVVPFAIFCVGVSWLLSAITVYFRDINQLVGLLASVLLFLSPIFYPVSALPDIVRAYIYLNPLTAIIEQLRNIVLWGKPPSFSVMLAYFTMALLVVWVGNKVFNRMRKGFADVI